MLFSTHILSDAETLCDRVAVLRGGRLVRVGALGEILRVDVARMEVLVVGPQAGLAVLDGEAHREVLGDRIRLEVEEKALGRAIASIESAGGRVLSVQPLRQSLEDYFYREMGGLRGGNVEEGP